MQSAVHPKVCLPVLTVSYILQLANKYSNMTVRHTGTASHRSKKIRVNFNDLLHRTGC
jgi:hypothetical protein